MSFSRSGFVLATCLGFVYAAPRIAFAVPPDPCSLLTQAKVSAALGASVGAGKGAGTRICRWAAPGGRPGVSPALVLTMHDAKEFDFAKSPSKSANLVKTPAADVGDEAVLNTVGAVTAVLFVKKGDTYFELHVYGFPLDQTKTLETTLAKDIVAKLK